MAQEAELRIKSDSIEKTTSAIDALIDKLELLDKSLGKVEAENKKQETSQSKTNTALKNAEIARKKAVEMLDLHKQGLGKLTDAFATEQAAIKAREIAAKKGISTDSEAYEALLKNVQATELAIVASKRLAEEEKIKAAETLKAANANKTSTDDVVKKTAAEKLAESTLNKSNITRESAIKLLKLEEQGLDRLSDEYADAKGQIIGMQQAQLKGIKSGTAEYDQLIKNTKAIEKSTAARKRLERSSQDGSKGANKFTNSLDDMAKQASLVDGPLGGIASRMTTLSTIIKQTGIGGALALTALGVSVGFLGFQLSAGVSAASATEVSMKTLEAQVEQTGHAAGFTAEQLDMLARSVAMSTLNSTEEVRGSITTLLAFTKVSGDIFEQAISKAEDIAILRQSGTKEVVKKLGKVLENPIERYKELIELGIEFDGTQVDAIKKAQAQNDLYKAQQIIMEGVGAKFKDVAVAQADTLAGDVDTFGQKWEEYFEMLGSKGLPALRSTTQAAIGLIDYLHKIGESNIETSMKVFKQDMKDAAKEAGGLEGLAEAIRYQIEGIESGRLVAEAGFLESQWQKVRVTMEAAQNTAAALLNLEYTVDTDALTIEQQELIKLREQLKLLTEEEEKRAKQSKNNSDEKSKEYRETLRELTEEVDHQTKLTAIYMKSGDTRSKAYREEKAGYDALNKAKKINREDDEEYVNLLKAEYLELANLTEQRVTYNTILQKSKALENQQSDLENEITLYKATTSGVIENSDAYIELAASLKTANEVKSMGGEISEEAIAKLQAENVALLQLQNSQRVLNALKAGDSNSANISTLKRQIELQKLQASGIRKTSEEYIQQEERLKALDVVRKNNVAVGSDEYIQLLSNAEAMANYRSQLQKTQDIADLGIVVRFDGMQQLEGSLAQIASAKAEALSNVTDMTGDGEGQIDPNLAAKIKEQIILQFQDKANQVLIPLGFMVDEEGNQSLIDSVAAVEAEARAVQRELQTAWEEGEIANLEAFNQRKLDIELEYEEKVRQAKEAAHQKSAEHIALSKAQEVGGVIKGGVDMLAAVSSNNKKLIKISKAMSVFNASASLVDALSEAYKAGFPLDIPLAAKALTQGTALIMQAKSLNEPSFAFGGVDIQGAGTGRSDSIKANIARGESVVTASATSKHKSTLQRMNAGLPIGGGRNTTFSSAPSIVIQGDASERTVGLIELKLRDYEDRVHQIAQGVSQQTIQEENEVGGFLNPI